MGKDTTVAASHSTFSVTSGHWLATTSALEALDSSPGFRGLGLTGASQEV